MEDKIVLKRPGGDDVNCYQSHIGMQVGHYVVELLTVLAMILSLLVLKIQLQKAWMKSDPLSP